MSRITERVWIVAAAMGVLISAGAAYNVQAKGGTHTPSSSAPPPCKYMTSGTPEYAQCVADWKKQPPATN
jgi:hypothetical protein